MKLLSLVPVITHYLTDTWSKVATAESNARWYRGNGPGAWLRRSLSE